MAPCAKASLGGVLENPGGGSLPLVVGSALSMPLGHLYHLGCSVGSSALLPALPSYCNRHPLPTASIRPSPFSWNKKMKAGPLKGRGLLILNIYPAALMSH